MKKTLVAMLAAGLACSIGSVADARDGCGAGAHRGPYGHCRPNHGGPVVGPGAVIAPGLVIGNFYPGRGYWDGRRYWERRDRGHHGWRYRH